MDIVNFQSSNKEYQKHIIVKSNHPDEVYSNSNFQQKRLDEERKIEKKSSFCHYLQLLHRRPHTSSCERKVFDETNATSPAVFRPWTTVQ
ncbi:hypothetical protein PanWU01x14_365440 [Parasponia andersonii]|uniref:Uncharacterized protein n=1 Tax=Parasponia andersonii TaxID=3476 RepID=A0A2P5A5Z8_PARAD|nr:hypothetical protein PanWU01x14_365440 [Parasponia andersonii]